MDTKEKTKNVRYRVIHKGKDTGIRTSEKKISIKELQRVVPNAKPFDEIRFEEETQ